MRILFVLALSIVMIGCGQDYEDINGIKLGAPIDSVKNIENYEGSVGDRGATVYLLTDEDGSINVENGVGIEVFNGDIGSVGFTKHVDSYKYDYSNFRFFLSKLIERWGDPESDEFKEENDKITRFVLFKPKNSIVGEIEVFYSESKGRSYIEESYTTKKHLSNYTKE